VKTEWDDVAGLTEVKRDVELNLLGAMQRPELFTGLLQPARGILFYGPPGATPASPVVGGVVSWVGAPTVHSSCHADHATQR
jgi:hypothetical protein